LGGLLQCLHLSKLQGLWPVDRFPTVAPGISVKSRHMLDVAQRPEGVFKMCCGFAQGIMANKRDLRG
jgi:hypothetical protein